MEDERMSFKMEEADVVTKVGVVTGEEAGL